MRVDSRGVSGLGSDRLQLHPRLAQAGEACMPQLVAVACASLPVGGRRLAPRPVRPPKRAGPVLAFNNTNTCSTPDWATLSGEFRPSTRRRTGHRRERCTGGALTVGDEHPPLTRSEIVHPQPEHLTAPQPAQQHQPHHPHLPVSALRVDQPVDLVGPKNPRQPPRCPHQRATSQQRPARPRRQTPRRRVPVHLTRANRKWSALRAALLSCRARRSSVLQGGSSGTACSSLR